MQGLTPEPQSADIVEISLIFGRRALLGQKLESADATAVIDHSDALLAVVLQPDLDSGGPRIDGVVDKLLDAVADAGDDLLSAQVLSHILTQ